MQEGRVAVVTARRGRGRGPYPGAGLFCGRRLGGCGGRGGGVALPSGTPGCVSLLCWLRASMALGTFAADAGGVGARGSAEREEGRGERRGQASGATSRPSHRRLFR